ncbi:TPA: hypothetical protein ACHGWQ_006048, partial [Escherichia coli]
VWHTPPAWMKCWNCWQVVSNPFPPSPHEEGGANCLMRFAYQAYNIKHNLFCRSDKVFTPHPAVGTQCLMRR